MTTATTNPTPRTTTTTRTPSPDAALAVLDDLRARRELGISRYGRPVTAADDADWASHWYEEQLDAVVYARAVVDEVDGLRAENAELRTELAKANAKLFNVALDNGELSLEVKRLRADIGYGGSPPPYQTWMQRVQELKCENQIRIDELVAIRGEVDRFREELAAADARDDVLADAVDTARRELAETRAVLARIADEKAAAERKLAAVVEHCDSLKFEHEVAVTTADEVLDVIAATR